MKKGPHNNYIEGLIQTIICCIPSLGGEADLSSLTKRASPRKCPFVNVGALVKERSLSPHSPLSFSSSSSPDFIPLGTTKLLAKGLVETA